MAHSGHPDTPCEHALMCARNSVGSVSKPIGINEPANRNDAGQPDVLSIGPRRSAWRNQHDKISMDRGGCGLVAGWNFARNGKNPGGCRCASRHQQDHVAPDFSGPLLSLVRPVLWLFRSIPGLVRLLCCAAVQSGLQLRPRETGRLAIVQTAIGCGREILLPIAVA